MSSMCRCTSAKRNRFLTVFVSLHLMVSYLSSLFHIICLLLFLSNDDMISSLQSIMYTSQITFHMQLTAVLSFVRRKMKVINLEVYIHMHRKEKKTHKSIINHRSLVSYSEQQHFLFITLARNRVRVLYGQVECQRDKNKRM